MPTPVHRQGAGQHRGEAPLERCLDQDVWAGGPWSGPAARLVDWSTVALAPRERDLGEVLAEAAARFSRPHRDTQDERRLFGRLEHQLGTLVDGWASSH